MGEFRAVEYSQEYSEEKTEPFSQSEIEARMQSIRGEELNAAMLSTIPLDKLVVPPDRGIRLLVRPLTTRGRSVSPGNQDNCEWLALRAEVTEPEQPQHKVLAVTQTARDIKFSVRIPGEQQGEAGSRPPLWCELYYDPASDNQILYHRSDVPLTLARISQDPAASPGMEYTVNPNTTKALSPGTWRIKVQGTDVLDFRILEKRPATLRSLPSLSSSTSSSSDMVNSFGKRSFTDDDALLSPEKKHRSASSSKPGGDGVIMFLRNKADPLVFPLPTAAKGKELATAGSHALLDMKTDEVAEIPGGCEIDQYSILKREPIASSTQSSVFTAEHSNVPDGIITVKILKTRSANPAAKQQENERSVIQQADVWLREFQSQEDLQHQSIVRLYGGDARYLSLYMEHVDGMDLSKKGVWRAAETNLFRGTRSDALRILRNVSSGLHYIHSRGLVHNDIKPANVLYSRERGAVLCDFGLSTFATSTPMTGGTPYYVPPEFIGHRLRGPASDVWALGVTMLYVLGKIAFPDARGAQAHPRRLYWKIAEVNRAPARDAARPGQMSAVAQMQQWLLEIKEARAKLNLNDKLERIVSEMLVPQPQYRITMRRVMSELFTEQITER